MGDHRRAHLSDEQLVLFQDGDLPQRQAGHLQACPECGSRLRDLQAAGAAYVEYCDSIRGPALPPVPKPWRSLDALIAEREAEPARQARRWWLVPALGATVWLAVAMIVALRGPARQPSTQVNELLMRSARAELPPNRMISMRLRGRTLIRPAVLVTAGPAERDPDLAHLGMLFAEAHYNWREPLSARSFQSWRSGLRDKRDSVTAIDAGGPKQAYRVQTDTVTGVLRSASLTFRGQNLRPTNGAFQFEGEEPLEMDEATPLAPGASEQPRPVHKESPVETPASPADTLHVLAALNEIGADVGEPIDVSEDAQHRVVVRATGLSVDRRQQVAAVLKPLPRVRLDLDAAPLNERPAITQTGRLERFSAGMPAALRQQFEDRIGGAVALQEMTDRVLETSGSAVSRAHAIEVLANKFSPQTESGLADQDRELLQKLQQLHVSELRRLASRIRMELKPLLPASNTSMPSAASENRMRLPWQTQAHELVAAAQRIDDSLNRLLAGSFTQPSGEAMLGGLAGQLEYLEQMLDVKRE